MSVSLERARGLRIVGTGIALPSDLADRPRVAGRISNDELYRALFGARWQAELAQRGWTAGGPRERYGIESREWLHLVGTPLHDDALDAGDLATLAARRALEDAGATGASVDILVAATSTPPRITSTLAARVGVAVGCRGACLDVRAGGAGGLAAWITAARMLGGSARRALVVAAEASSHYLDAGEPGIAAVYGDAAGALVVDVDPSCEGGLLLARFERRDPTGVPFTVPTPLPPRISATDVRAFRFQHPNAAYTALVEATWHDTLSAFAGIDVDVFVPYAVTSAQVERACATLGITAERTVHRLADLGCTGAAGPLVHVHTARHRAEWRRDAVLASAAVAGGVTSVALAWRS
ncbi:MAG: 3-oxoacyl-[acyl-carrier-protein] synthase III C-terminal domain-containing protein [Planctomycetota bacterium]